MSTYDVIIELCSKNNIAPTALEKELGFSNGSIGKLKTGNTSAKRLQKIADYFEVSVEYLMTGEEKTESDYSNVSKKTRDNFDFIIKNPEYEVLLELSKRIPKDDIEMLKSIMEKFQKED